MINELLPARAVLREFGPLLEVRRYACPLERLVQRMPERELWTPMRPWPADPGSEKLPRRPILRHACDVASPPELAERDVVVHRLHLHLLQQLRCFDPTSPHSASSDAEHHPHAVMMKHSKPVKQRLGKAPALAAIKKYVDDKRQIYRLFGSDVL